MGGFARNQQRIVLQVAVSDFNNLCSEYEAAKNGYRASLYKFAAQCYRVGHIFNKRTDQFDRFKDDPFWANVRQKPKDDKKMRAVLVYATKSNPGVFPSLITKTAKVLEDMAGRGVKASDVAKRLKEGGGIEKLYAALSPSRNGNARVPDDLEMLVPNRSEDETEDSGAGGEETSEGARSDDLDWDSDPEDSDTNANIADEPIGKPPAKSRVANGGPMITEFGGTASPPRPSGWKYDPDRHLIVDVSQLDLSLGQVLDMKKAAITFRVGLPDLNGWRPCVALRVEPMTDEDDDELVDGEDNDGDAEEGWPTDDDEDA